MAREPAAYQPPTATAATTPATKPLTMYNDKKIVATRSSRAGDDGYQLSTAYEQVTIILEDGSDKVLKRSDLTIPA